MPDCCVMPDHPGRSSKSGFAASFLISRPPLLYQEGSCLALSLHANPFTRASICSRRAVSVTQISTALPSSG